MKDWIKKNHFVVFAVVIGLLMLVISIIRACITGITYDEAFTYLNYGRNSIFYAWGSLFNTDGILANNHILNTFFISVINMFSGGQYIEFLVRLPNIVFYAIYIIFAYKLANKYKANYLCFVLLVFNYGVHEFFGLARGYGMAACLVLIGLYYLKIWIDDKLKFNFLNISYMFMMLGAYANTVTLIVFASVFVYTVVILIKEKILIKYIKEYWYYIGIMVALGLLIIRYHFKISADGLPLYGGGSGFFNSVLVSIFETYGFGVVSAAGAIIYIILYVCGIAYLRKKALKWEAFYLPIICFVILIGMTLVTKQLWITGRSLIPFTPLIVFGFIELIESCKISNNIIQYIISIIMIIPFFVNLNITGTREWADNYEIKPECYRAYEEKDSSIIQKYEDYPPVVDFYIEKIIKEYGYNIVEGV